MTDYRYLSITDVSEQLRQQHVSPVTLVTECLASIERYNPKLNAFITVMAEQALTAAKIAENDINNGQWRGPLHGIPIGVKDFFDTAGIKTTAAFGPFKDRVPAHDATIVTRLKAAGAIIIGKTNMHELGMGTTSVISHFGSVHNPWNREYIAGGSSGGSAAAIAAGLCYAPSIQMPLAHVGCQRHVAATPASKQRMAYSALRVSWLARRLMKSSSNSVILLSSVAR